MVVKWKAPFLDSSGYGQASRTAIIALDSVGVDLVTDLVSFSKNLKSSGPGYKIALENMNSNKKYRIKIIQLTPNMFPPEIEKDKYNIGFFFWEVVGLDPMWVWSCNQMDEIWTSSHDHAEVMRTFGVKVPIFVFPVPIEEYDLSVKKSELFRFYSVFQWTERKNPRSLIRSYFNAFKGNDKVELALKVYRSNFSHKERGAIMDDIEDFKRMCPMKEYPKISLYLDEMSGEDIMKFHSEGNVFVSSHRGEGWGIPQAEAMSVGNPIISTNWGGIHKWLDNSCSWLIPFTWSNVRNMDHIKHYSTDNLWASIDEKALQSAMIEAYNNPSLVKSKGEKSRELVRKEFSMNTVGNLMKERLEKL